MRAAPRGEAGELDEGRVADRVGEGRRGRHGELHLAATISKPVQGHGGAVEAAALAR